MFYTNKKYKYFMQTELDIDFFIFRTDLNNYSFIYLFLL